MKQMRVVFLGTPDFALPSLKMLIEQGYEITGVFTQPDKPRGRGMKDAEPPVKELAVSFGLPVFQFKRIRDAEAQQALAQCKPDVMVTAAFGQILSAENLATPPLGCINVHASLLPKYRGAAPIQWAIINGETKTGITTMFTDIGLDTGDMILKREVDISPEETGGELFSRLAILGAEVLRDTLRLVEAGKAPREEQDEAQATKCTIIKKETGHINWSDPAERIRNLARACDPWPGAYSHYRGQILKVWKARKADPTSINAEPGTIITADPRKGLIAAAGDGAIEIIEMQSPGGKRMNAKDYLRGNPMQEGTCFEDIEE